MKANFTEVYGLWFDGAVGDMEFFMYLLEWRAGQSVEDVSKWLPEEKRGKFLEWARGYSPFVFMISNSPEIFYLHGTLADRIRWGLIDDPKEALTRATEAWNALPDHEWPLNFLPHWLGLTEDEHRRALDNPRELPLLISAPDRVPPKLSSALPNHRR